MKKRAFYKDKKKVISQKLKQLLKSPLSLAMWFMDDGCAEYAGVSFNTQCFSLKEVRFLSQILTKQYNRGIIMADVMKMSSNRNKIQSNTHETIIMKKKNINIK